MRLWRSARSSLSLRELGATGLVIGVVIVLLVTTGLVVAVVGSPRGTAAAPVLGRGSPVSASPERVRAARAQRTEPGAAPTPGTSEPSSSNPPVSSTAPSTAVPPVAAQPTGATKTGSATVPGPAASAGVPPSPATTTTEPAVAPAVPFSWSPPTSLQLGKSVLTGISCPSVSLCVATDNGGDVFTATDPSGGVWVGANVAGPFPLGTPACPSTSLCVIPDVGGVMTSTDPTGGTPAWTQTTLPAPGGATPAWQGVSCPSVTLCVAVGRSTIATSTNPAGGATAWTVVAAPNDAVFDKPDLLNAVSCPIASFCTAVGAMGMVYTSTDPTGGTKSWVGTEADTYAVQICEGCVNLANSLVGVSCPTPALCVAIDPIGDVLTSTDPGADAPSWTITALDEQWIPLNYVSCLSSTYCLAGPYYSSSPASNSGWIRAGFEYESSVTCPAVSTCVAVAGDQVSVGTYDG
ncbi:MAG: hypothetical protein ACLP9C_03555 [Acidimicrobiales bacterium]